jgi:hypothetical protein
MICIITLADPDHRDQLPGYPTFVRTLIEFIKKHKIMSRNRKDPHMESSAERSIPERTDRRQRDTKQSSSELNRNEERTSARSSNSSNQRHPAGSKIPGTQAGNENMQGQGKNPAGRSYTGNSERSGQQYSIEGNSSQGMDKINKSPQDRSSGAQRPGIETEEGRQRLKGMNAPDRKQKQESHQHHQKDQRDQRNRQDDLSSGEE